MRFTKSFKLAVNILLHSKIRSWLTIIGIVIGVAAIVAIVSIGEGAQANVQARLGGLGADIITISSGAGRASNNFGGGGGSVSGTTAKNLTIKDVDTIRPVPGVMFVDGIVSGRADMSYLTETSSVSVQGVDPFAWSNMDTTGLSEGRYLQASDVNAVVIGNRIATRTFKTPIGLNQLVTIGGRSFKVVGILAASDGAGQSDSAVYMTQDQARLVLVVTDTKKVNSISVKVSDPVVVQDVANAIDARLLTERHLTNRTRDFSVMTAQATQQRIVGITQTFTLFLAAIAGVSLVVGAVGIANTMFTSVLEKTKEIGIMKAIGAKNRDILMIFMLNAALVGLVGGLIGIALGAAAAGYLPSLLGSLGPVGRVSSVIPLSLLVEAMALSIGIGVVAGVIPAYRASKLKPVDALRYE